MTLDLSDLNSEDFRKATNSPPIDDKSKPIITDIINNHAEEERLLEYSENNNLIDENITSNFIENQMGIYD